MFSQAMKKWVQGNTDEVSLTEAGNLPLSEEGCMSLPVVPCYTDDTSVPSYSGCNKEGST